MAEDYLHEMSQSRLMSVLPMFRMRKGEYIVEKSSEFGESEFYWVIRYEATGERFLLVNTYSHHGAVEEIRYYEENGFEIDEVILRKNATLEKPKYKNNPKHNYLFEMYSLFRLK